MTDGSGMQSGFGRQLAHTDKSIRDRAVRGLTKWLVNNEEIKDLDLLKLWKGLFYSFWMSDKPLIQQHLADKLASLALHLPQSTVLRYIRAFWTIIVADWHGIDRLRLDKYYMLLRKFHFYGFKYLESKGWDADVVGEYLQILKNGPLKLNDLKTPDSLRYHTAEVYLEELQRAVGGKATADAVFQLLDPFFDIISKSANDVVFAKVRENIFEHILDQTSKDDSAMDHDVPSLPFDCERIGRRIFDIAIGSDVLVKNRPKVQHLFKAYAKVVKIDVDESLLKTSKGAIKGTKSKPDHLIDAGPATLKVNGKGQAQSEPKSEERAHDDLVGSKRKAAPVDTSEEDASPRKKKKKGKKGKTETADETAQVMDVKENMHGESSDARVDVTGEGMDGIEQYKVEVKVTKIPKAKTKKTQDATGALPLPGTVTDSIDPKLSPVTPQSKQKKTGKNAMTVPAKQTQKTLLIATASSDPRKSVKFVMEKNMVKSFDIKEPVAEEGTPSRKTETSAPPVLKPALATPVAKKLESLLKSAVWTEKAHEDVQANETVEEGTPKGTPKRDGTVTESKETPGKTSKKSPKAAKSSQLSVLLTTLLQQSNTTSAKDPAISEKSSTKSPDPITPQGKPSTKQGAQKTPTSSQSKKKTPKSARSASKNTPTPDRKSPRRAVAADFM
ncbi:uncharacterized protein SPPG_05545 [Spizellomyces punctatus DAOM BR117]|uniref:Uncharacterized protein n=1 Tax=Spizellomyces punctatus (strain DAOM BR117) TaxID=645134 RepID=A0A0L0HE48_SPIPD|nr:uncharacterized protein SPPG_05545 [Spizellomyces punctatus DAOM BR117]KNC99291.1 hypothetical protein SPPG_05545 [Spizellomyces punctatus DAOM BR117]|eukprot:XP_016607331.1 hypothetical protein SPPG_05545 [Spizellomyces punctatus DAOM BR117]